MSDKKDYIDLKEGKKGLDDVRQRFTERLRELEEKHTKEHTPFCRKAALDHFDRLIAMHRSDNELDKQFKGDGKIISINLDEFPWEKFEDPKNFILLTETPIQAKHPFTISAHIITEWKQVFMWAPLRKDGTRDEQHGYKHEIFWNIDEWNMKHGIEAVKDQHGHIVSIQGTQPVASPKK